MPLPNMRPGLTSREFLRIAGGYGAGALGRSPAGGMDVDNAGNLATDGDITIKGLISAGSTPQAITNANGEVDGARIQSGTVDTAQLADDAVTPSKLGAGDFVFAGDILVQRENAIVEVSRATYSSGSGHMKMSNTSDLYLTNSTNVGGADLFLQTRNGTHSWQFDSSGSATFPGDLTVNGGDVIAGSDGGTRGVLTVWDGSGGSAPGCLKLASPNGTVWYLFVEDDGTLKVHSALPTQNADGTEVGTQT